MEYISILAQATEIVETAQTTPQSSNSQWIILIVLFAAMYFLLIAPQRKKEKLRRKMLSETKVGDEVITIGGICGVITNKTDKTYILKVSDNTKIEFLIAAVNTNVTQEKANTISKK
ncbi:MAG: preprotein translocase subunit YajC [Opitutales bacterium]